MWSSWVLQSAFELTLLLALVALFDRAVQLRVRPRIRQVVWSVVLIRLLLPPDLWWPSFGAGFEATVPAAVSNAGATSARIALAIWAAGVMALVVWWIAREQLAAARLQSSNLTQAERRHLTALSRQAGLRGSPRLALDQNAHAPYVTGLIAPRLVLPAAWREWERETLDHAIGHELTHLRRRDLWMEALWMAAAAVYWFHPLVHLARRRAHETREMCCDADVAHRIGPAYGVSMLRLVATLADRSAAGTPMQHAWSPAIVRLKALQRWSPSPNPRTRALAVIAAALSAALALPGHWRFIEAPAARLNVESLLDPQARQGAGLGSMHLRYLILQRQQQTRTN